MVTAEFLERHRTLNGKLSVGTDYTGGLYRNKGSWKKRV